MKHELWTKEEIKELLKDRDETTIELLSAFIALANAKHAIIMLESQIDG